MHEQGHNCIGARASVVALGDNIAVTMVRSIKKSMRQVGIRDWGAFYSYCIKSRAVNMGGIWPLAQKWLLLGEIC